MAEDAVGGRRSNDNDQGDVDRYRAAAEDALQQLDWCIGYLHGIGKTSIARSLSRNRSYIRTHLMKAPDEGTPETDQSAVKE